MQAHAIARTTLCAGLLALSCAASCATPGPADIDPLRARFNYQMACQGCHTADGSGARAVPRMKDFVGTFLQTRAGREYLVRVPGSATSALDDGQLAEVLNWIIVEFAGASAAADFVHYTATEVGALRQSPLFEVERYRVQMLMDIAANRRGKQAHD